MLYHLPLSIQVAQNTIHVERNTSVSLEGVIQTMRMRKTRGKKHMMISEGTLDTGQGTITLMWFNMPFIATKYQAGSVVRIQGTITGSKDIYISNPYIEHIHETKHTPSSSNAPVTPIYRSVNSLSSTWFHSTIHSLLKKIHVEDVIPKTIRTTYNLPSRNTALHNIHNPKTKEEYIVGEKYVAFEYIFLMKLSQARSKAQHKKETTYPVTITQSLAEYTNAFPFKLTNAQKKVFKSIVHDLKQETPMIRLLEGDVGSGKTAVAAMALQAVATSPHPFKKAQFLQAAYMTPTEILARQQFEFLCDMFRDQHIHCALVTGSGCEVFPSKTNKTTSAKVSKRQMAVWLEEGVVRIIVGTHALIQKNISFRDCALVIIDEQHKFGVAQRHSFFKKHPTIPHVLSMTATPIPRTLALTLYGDLDISILDELPKGRKYAHTTIIQKDETDMYATMQQELKKKHQIYVVCPRIEESDKSDMAAVESEKKNMQNMFPTQTIETIHGKMNKQKQQEVLEKFSNGTIDILIATTVVEVGVNVPNATCMIIKDADRFGLAQLHQIRGRVLRSTEQAYCFACTHAKKEETLKRLKHFEENADGFDLAEKDLELRGAGELSGVRQSGVTDLMMKALKNTKLIEAAHHAVEKVMQDDITQYPTLEKEMTIIAPTGD